MPRRVPAEGGSEVDALRILAAVHRDAGRHDLALELANEAVALARDVSDRRVEADALNTLATVHRCQARLSQAVGHHERALHLAQEATNDYSAVAALTGLAVAHVQLARTEQAEPAETYAGQAITLARRCGYVDLEGHAQTALAAVHLAQDRLQQACRHGRRALKVHGDTGHRLGEANAHLVVGQALHRRGSVAADKHLQRALALFAAIGTPPPVSILDGGEGLSCS